MGFRSPAPRARARSARALEIGLAAGLAVALLSGCRGLSLPMLAAHTMPARGGTVTEAIVGAPGVLNPLLAQDDSARDIDSLIYQGLTAVGPDQQPAPLLACGWTLSTDRLTYTFTLRQGVRWADGRPFTVEDVLFTFQVLQDPTYMQGANPWREIRVVEVASDQVAFTLKAPSASFPFLLTIGILPSHAFVSSRPADVANDPHSGAQAFGTGPFMVGSISADRRSVDLVRNPYASPAPYLDGFDFRTFPTSSGAANAVLDGQADMMGAIQPPQLAPLLSRPDLAVHEQRTFAMMSLFFDLSARDSVYFDPPLVRRALNQAIDREAIVKDVLGGHADPAYGPIPPTNWAYSASLAGRGLTYDPGAARRSLETAGWLLPPGKQVRERGGKQFELTLVTADAYPYRQVAGEIQAQLARAGVKVVLEGVPSSILVGHYLIPREFQLALAQLDSGPDADQSAFWHSAPLGTGLNFTPLPHQALIDKDLEDAEAITRLQDRRAFYDDFQSLVAQAAPAAFLYEPHYLYVVSRRVHGVRLSPVIEPADRFRGVAGWYVMRTGG